MHGEPSPGVEMGKLRLEEILFENASLPAEILQLDHLGTATRSMLLTSGLSRRIDPAISILRQTGASSPRNSEATTDCEMIGGTYVTLCSIRLVT